jgi:hypothetical protein
MRSCESKGTVEGNEIMCESKGTVDGNEITCESMGAIGDVEFGRYEVYVVSPQLREERGLALIDSGSMISLVRESSVVKFKAQR